MLGGSGNKISIDLDVNDPNFKQKFDAAKKTIADFSGSSATQLGKLNAEADRLNKTIANKQSWDNFKNSAGLAIAAVAGGLLALKKGFDFAKEGAQLQYTAVKFDRLSQSIGTTSDALLGDLKKATKGTYSDFELMANVTDLVGLGLAKDHDEAVRLATVASGLNMNMNQLVLTLTNMTTMRFDALGVSVDGFKDKVDELKTSGLSADAAFKEAFLQQAEMQLAKVGNAADTSLGSFMRFEASVKNLGDEAKMAAGAGLAPLVEKIAAGMAAEREFSEILQKVNPELMKQFQWSQVVSDEMVNVVNEYKRAAQYGEAWGSALEAQAAAAQSTIPVMEDLSTATAEVSKANQDMISMYGSVQGEIDNYKETQSSLREKMAELKAEYQAGSVDQEEYKNKVHDITDAMRQNEQAHIQAGKSIVFSLVQQRLAADGLSETETKMLQNLGVKMGIFSQEAVDMANNFMIGASQIVDNSGDMDGALRDPLGTMTGINEKIEGFASKSGSMWDFYINIHTTGRIPNLPELNQANQAQTNQCFIAGTLVTMADGTHKPIQLVAIGDKVLTYDFTQRRNVEAEVSEVFHHPAAQTRFYLMINGIGVTDNHPVWTPEGWREAGMLKLGDCLVDVDGNFLPVTSIATIGHSVPTYNLHIDHPDHNYYAAGVRVHNKAGGGQVFGPGDGSRDTFLAPLANEEFVVRSDVVRKPGVLQFLTNLNSGRTSGFAQGGMVRLKNGLYISRRGYARGGFIDKSGPSAGINQQQRDRNREGQLGGVTSSIPSSVSITEAIPEAVAPVVMATGGYGGAGGGGGGGGLAQQTLASTQSAQSLMSIDQKMSILIGAQIDPRELARASATAASLSS